MKILLWLEDKPEELADLINKAKTLFDEVIIRRNPMGIKNAFDKFGKNVVHQIKGIVIDVMLPHIHDLEGVGAKHIKTPGGFDAGIHFIKHYLLKEIGNAKIPICVFTVVEDNRLNALLNEDKNIQNMTNENKISIEVIEKFVEGWDEKFISWIKNL